MNRKIISCHQVCAVEQSARADRVGQDGQRQRAAASEDVAEPAENAPPRAQPTRKAAWIYALFSFTAGSLELTAPSSWITGGVATSV